MSQSPGFTSSQSEKGSRGRNYILGTIALLFLALIATQVFLHQTSVGSPKFIRMTFLLWTGTLAVVLALLILATVLGRNLIKIYFERKSGKVGSRFKTKMVSTFVVLSLLPALLLFLLAYQLINSSIEQWFRAPGEQMLENSKAIALQYYDDMRLRLQRFAARIGAAAPALDSQESRAAFERRLAELRLDYGLDNVRLFDQHGRSVLESGARVSLEAHASHIESLVAGALKGQSGFQVERATPSDALREIVWAAAPMRDSQGRTRGAVLTESLIARSVHFNAYSVIEAYNAYSQLQSEQASLRFTFMLILALSTLLIVFAFSWFAMYLAKRITIPIQALAEGAAAVAAGNLNYRVNCQAFDELESLVSSFNRMTGELQENKEHIEAAQDSLRRTNVELDDRRRYIETILQTIATGVVSLDDSYRIRTLNRAAVQMLDLQPGVVDVPVEDVVKGSGGDTLRMLLQKSAVLGPVARTLEFTFPGRTLHVATTVTPLADAAGQPTGWVIVLDDVTELLRIEKMAAWQEVARRLAHEIKNPLTPIQLSAERILRRYRQIQFPASAAVGSSLQAWQSETKTFERLLEESVNTITQEAASLKNLVDEFSRFARLREVRPEEAELHGIIESTLSLYNGRIQDIQVVKLFDREVPKLKLDKEQMRRVFINLFDNAVEAMAQSAPPKILQIRTWRNPLQHSVRVEIADTGRGFPREYQDSVFLPYFSTRKGGTGLGLAIVRQIISDHHGRVYAEPNVPAGARIVIDLPLAAV